MNIMIYLLNCIMCKLTENSVNNFSLLFYCIQLLILIYFPFMFILDFYYISLYYVICLPSTSSSGYNGLKVLYCFYHNTQIVLNSPTVMPHGSDNFKRSSDMNYAVPLQPKQSIIWQNSNDLVYSLTFFSRIYPLQTFCGFILLKICSISSVL